MRQPKNIPQERLISPDLLRIVRLILFFAVFFKYTGIGLWPHIYNGEQYTAPKWKYYLDFFTLSFSFLSILLHIETIGAIIKHNIVILIFCAAAVLIPYIFVGERELSVTVFDLAYFEIFFAVILMIKFDGEEMFLKASVYFGLLFVIINTASAIQPSRSMMHGLMVAFRGLTPHRNDLSWYSVYFLLATYCSKRNVNAVVRILVAVGSVLLILAAASVQGVLLSVLGLVVILLMQNGKLLRNPFFLMAFAPVIAALIVLISSPEFLLNFLGLFGRDLSFSGRDRIWAMSTLLIQGVPWYGYGQGSMSSAKLSEDFLNMHGVGTAFGTAHNSYIEAILSYGWIGSAPFFFLTSSQAIRAIKATIRPIDYRQYFPVSLTIVCLVGGLTASEKLFLPGFGWLCFCTGKVMLDSMQVPPTGMIDRKSVRRAPAPRFRRFYANSDSGVGS